MDLSGIRLLISRLVFGGYLFLKTGTFYVRKYWYIVILGLFLSLVIVIYNYAFPTYHEDVYQDAVNKTVLIPKGSSLRQIAQILETEDLLHSVDWFILIGKISGYQNKLQAGLFLVPEGMHPWHLLLYLTQPKLANIKVTLPEGLLASEMAQILFQKLHIDSAYFMSFVNDSAFCHRVGIEANSLEGYLLPETYFFTYEMDEEDIILTLLAGMFSIFEADSVQNQMTHLKMNRHQILTLASIVEGEVVVDSERALVSSVYHNRLRRGWHLAADPTIQYIIPGPPRRLLNADLEIDSPYNTYKYRGLPPGPISNPGRLSVLAAIFPEQTRYMYFVASGDGGHHFSQTAAEHAQWKSKFDRIRREVRRKERQKGK
ncbi:MAG: endolytic transglycosylase MltG [bacterium]|nr:MAG: endolytic transglycosylase MltG [bacterium]